MFCLAFLVMAYPQVIFLVLYIYNGDIMFQSSFLFLNQSVTKIGNMSFPDLGRGAPPPRGAHLMR